MRAAIKLKEIKNLVAEADVIVAVDQTSEPGALRLITEKAITGPDPEAGPFPYPRPLQAQPDAAVVFARPRILCR